MTIPAERNPLLFFFAEILAKIVFPFHFQITSEGKEFVPDQGPFIFLSKHQRWEDIPLVGIVTPRPLYYVAKYELFVNPVSSWFLSRLGGIPLNRTRPIESRESFRHIIDFQKRGEGIVIFPEGTYFKDQMGPGQPGVLRLVRSRVRAPLIPVGIRYLEGKRRTRVHINFGQPVPDNRTLSTQELLLRIMGDIAELSGL